MNGEGRAFVEVRCRQCFMVYTHIGLRTAVILRRLNLEPRSRWRPMFPGRICNSCRAVLHSEVRTYEPNTDGGFQVADDADDAGSDPSLH